MYALTPQASGMHIKQITHAYGTTITCKSNNNTVGLIV